MVREVGPVFEIAVFEYFELLKERRRVETLELTGEIQGYGAVVPKGRRHTQPRVRRRS